MTATPLFGRSARASLHAVLDPDGGPLLLALDCDGTLAPIAPHPDRARVPAAVLRAIRRCAALPGVTVAVVSARTPRELRRLVPLAGVRRVGLYGLADRSIPAATRARWRRAVRLLLPIAVEAFAGIPGAWVERKGIALAAHDRDVRAGGDARRFALAARRVSAAARRLGLKAAGGSRVVEFLPRAGGKDRAVARLIRATGAGRVVYAGDSAADDPAFALLARLPRRTAALSIRVGRGPTKARYRVGNVEGMRRFLERVAAAAAA